MSLADQHNKVKKELAHSFTTVGNEPEGTTPDGTQSQEPKTDAPAQITSVDDVFATVVNKPKKKDKRPITVYLDEDVIKEFNKFGKQYGKGAKSEIINTFLRSKFLK